MQRSIQWSLLGSAAAVVLAACGTMGSVGGKSELGFFVTSSGPGKGADLGCGLGASSSCRTSGPPNALTLIAFIALLLSTLD